MSRFGTIFVRLAALALVSAVASVASFGLAQIDPQARALLEGLRPVEVDTIETLDQTTVTTVEAEGGTEFRSRTVIDYPGQRARIETEMAPGMSVVLVLTDGLLQMIVGGMRVPVPGELGEQFGGLLEGDPNDPLAGIERATFDGPVAYGGLVEGDQVTIVGATQVAGVEDAEETRYVFASDGGLLAVASPDGESGGEGTILMVFDDAFTGSTAVGRSGTLYRIVGEQVERVATTRFEDVRINEPVSDDLF